MKRWIGLLLFLFGMLFSGVAFAEGMTITYQASAGADTVVHTSEVDGITYLFLPSSARADQLTLDINTQGAITVTGETAHTTTFTSGEAVDINALFPNTPEDGRYTITLIAEDGTTQSLCLLFSANIRSLYLTSADPENEGRAWLDDCKKHEKSTTGSITLLRADGSVTHSGELSMIRGRGNTTWGNYPLDSETELEVDKKPYQVKLEEKVDLLDTGDPQEANKRWVLMADVFDGTLLHNRISYDLAREMGQESAPHCQPVDLYYDGEYRGLYLLSEKVEVDEGRVDITDYEQIIEKLNKKAGIDLDSLTQTTLTNRYGQTLVALDGVEDADATNLGGYLLELDTSYYTDEKAYFNLTNGMVFTVKNPEHASVNMVTYLSELFEDANAALTHYGKSPETGKLWTDYFDTDSLLPFFWTNELSRNPDVWAASTFLTLPQGGGKLSFGPVWDFDQGYYRFNEEGRTDATGLTDNAHQWGYDFCCIPGFQTLARQFFTDKLEPAVSDILLGDEDAHGTWLHSLTWYWQEESASRRMNDVLWDARSLFGAEVADSYEENYENLRTFLSQRIAWLENEVATWPESAPAKQVDITLAAPYADVADGLTLSMDDLHNNVAMATIKKTILTEATEEDYATWKAEITIAPKPDVVISDDLRVTVNGVTVPFTRNKKDGSITLTVLFEDPSYRVAEFEGTDYGLVFNADYYAAHYPEAVAEVGSDSEALLAYYVQNGLDEGQVANAFFDPTEVRAKIADAESMFGDNYEDMVNFFNDAGYADWMRTLGKTFAPEVRLAE